ncbi:MAG TPA: TIGR03086 family protein [Micromonosporaceae bacterium]|nr:TIGR03086 family protein [Micromonosporaceae bacterium]
MLELHRRTMSQSTEIVSLIKDEQWELPTPCTEWNLRQLVEHMILDNRGFAAAAQGEVIDRSVWLLREFDPGLRVEYARSADDVVTAFRTPVASFWLPRINDAITFPAAQAIGFHLLDYLVHGWDVAAAIGYPVAFDEDLIEAVQAIGDREVLNGPNRLRPNASFRPALLPKPGESKQDYLLRTLGRSPSWPD